MQTTNDRKVLTFAEGLRKLGISRPTAYELFADPKSDFVRPFRYVPRGRLYYREADIDAYLARKSAAAQTPTTPPSRQRGRRRLRRHRPARNDPPP
jgi:predicted DNA-binding transcriptional regulator AlpA